MVNHAVQSFSQSSLQSLENCPRQFQLRYLDKISWPAISAEPAEKYQDNILRGNKFHLLCQQYFAGIPAEELTAGIHDSELKVLWQNFLEFISQQNFRRCSAESIMTMPFGTHRLVAKTDLVAEISPDRYQIYDWKTSSSILEKSALSARLQTIMYPYLFTQAGKGFFSDQEIQPGQVEMIYWYAHHPESPQIFHYSEKLENYAIEKISKLIGLYEKLRSTAEIFPLTDNLETCRYCVYRSLCDRGGQAGSVELLNYWEEEEFGWNIDIEQVAVIEF